jgi:hypothetical protein
LRALSITMSPLLPGVIAAIGYHTESHGLVEIAADECGAHGLPGFDACRMRRTRALSCTSSIRIPDSAGLVTRTPEWNPPAFTSWTAGGFPAASHFFRIDPELEWLVFRPAFGMERR